MVRMDTLSQTRSRNLMPSQTRAQLAFKHGNELISVDLRAILGEGTFGTVRLAVDHAGKYYACKMFKLTDVEKLKELKVELSKESTIHSALGKHPNIIEFMGQVETRDYHHIFLEYGAGGELFDRIPPDVGIGEDLAHFYFQQLLNAVHYMHSRGVAHRDLKPENILLDSMGNLKVTDFGLATVFRHKGQVRNATTACGTPPYVAPEIHTYNYFAPLTDIWSSGIILYVLICGSTYYFLYRLLTIGKILRGMNPQRTLLTTFVMFRRDLNLNLNLGIR
jgi:serine/threonine-protein kinase Chk1